MKRIPARLPSCGNRRGAALVEGAFVLSVLVVVLFTALDLGLAAVRQTALAEGARRVARTACVRGDRSKNGFTAWGPAALTIDAAAVTEETERLRPLLVSMEPGDVTLSIEWPDGGNQVNDRVRVTVTYPHRPMMPFILGSAPLELTATSTMRIQH